MQSGTSGTRNRGFASMDAEKQREIARKGGRAAHEKGTAHEFTTDEARAAGRKGGERVSANREHMSRIGRLGGKMSAGGFEIPIGFLSGNQSDEFREMKWQTYDNQLKHKLLTRLGVEGPGASAPAPKPPPGAAKTGPV